MTASILRKCSRCGSNSMTPRADLRGTIFPSCITCGYENYTGSPNPYEQASKRLIKPGEIEVAAGLVYRKNKKQYAYYNKLSISNKKRIR